MTYTEAVALIERVDELLEQAQAEPVGDAEAELIGEMADDDPFVTDRECADFILADRKSRAEQGIHSGPM